MSVNKQEIFIVEGPRSIVRIATSVDPYGEGKFFIQLFLYPLYGT